MLSKCQQLGAPLQAFAQQTRRVVRVCSKKKRFQTATARPTGMDPWQLVHSIHDILELYLSIFIREQHLTNARSHPCNNHAQKSEGVPHLQGLCIAAGRLLLQKLVEQSLHEAGGGKRASLHHLHRGRRVLTMARTWYLRVCRLMPYLIRPNQSRSFSTQKAILFCKQCPASQVSTVGDSSPSEFRPLILHQDLLVSLEDTANVLKSKHKAKELRVNKTSGWFCSPCCSQACESSFNNVMI